MGPNYGTLSQTGGVGNMQSRTGSVGQPSEEKCLLAKPAQTPQTRAKREWSLPGFQGRIPNILLFFVVFCSGILLGVVVILHNQGFYRQPVLSSEQCRPKLNTLASFKQPFNPSQFWLTPGGFYHNLNDEELLWRASITPQRLGFPVSTTRKIAFLFLTKGPLPLAPLWERYFRGHIKLYTIYVHATPGFVLEVPSSSVFYGRQVPSQEIRWGEISMVDAERRLLANALLDFSNERFVLVSESCIPLSNFTTFYKAVIDSEVSHVASYDENGPYGRARWNESMEPEVKLDQWRKGAQWFEMKRTHAVFIVSDVTYYPKFRDFCVTHCYVDEHYIATILSIQFGTKEILGGSPTFVDWSRGGYHPATFNAKDISEAAMWKIANDKHCRVNGKDGQTCFFFARKFSPSTLRPLLKIAQSVMAIP